MFDSSLRDFSSVVFDDGLVIVDPTSGLLAVLNASGRLVWEYLAGGASVDETASRLARHYRIPASLARQGVDTLRAQSSDQGFGSEGAYRPRTKGNKFPLGADPREAIQPLAGTLGPAASCAAAYTYALRRHEAFRLVYTTNTLEEQLHPAFAHLEVTDVAPSHTLTFGRQDDDYFLLYDGALIERTAVLDDAYGELLGSVLNLSYPGVEWLAFLHTGAVSDGDRAILFPAESGAGKSTLVAALADAGLRYMGDDTIPIQRGTLLATPLPLSLRIKEGSWSLLEGSYPRLSQIGLFLTVKILHNLCHTEES